MVNPKASSRLLGTSDLLYSVELGTRFEELIALTGDYVGARVAYEEAIPEGVLDASSPSDKGHAVRRQQEERMTRIYISETAVIKMTGLQNTRPSAPGRELAAGHLEVTVDSASVRSE